MLGDSNNWIHFIEILTFCSGASQWSLGKDWRRGVRHVFECTLVESDENYETFRAEYLVMK